MCHLVLITLMQLLWAKQLSIYADLCIVLQCCFNYSAFHCDTRLWLSFFLLTWPPITYAWHFPSTKNGKKTYTILENLVWPNTRSKHVCAYVTVQSLLKSRFQINHRQLHCLFHESGGSWSCTLETTSSIAETVDCYFSFY